MKYLSSPYFWIFISAPAGAIAAIVTLREQDRQTAELRGWMTGGDSWAYYEPNWTKERNLAFFIRHVGRYPAYDVVLRIQDELTERTPGDPIYVAPAMQKGRGFDWMEPKALIFSEKPDLGESRRLKLEISMRSGTIVIQHIHLYETDGRWETRSKDVERNGVAVTLPSDFQEIQERAPLPLSSADRRR